MKWLLPYTGYSFFDVWAIVHLSFWIFIGSNLWAFRLKINKWWALGVSVVVAYAWEVFEHFMAPKHPDIWLDPESWWNAFLSDPLMCIVGILGICWLLEHRPRKP